MPTHSCCLFRLGRARPDSFWFRLDFGETEVGKPSSLVVARGRSQGFFILHLTHTIPKKRLCHYRAGHWYSFLCLRAPYKSTCGILSLSLPFSEAAINTGLITTQKYYSVPEEEFAAKIIGFIFVYVIAFQ